MYAKVTLMCLVAVALGRPDKPAPSGYGYTPPTPTYTTTQPSYTAPHPTYEKKEKGMPFDFQYAVKDHYKGLDFDHSSKSDGKVVNGQYRVVLPDGRTQIVTYTADHHNGYQVKVTYEGEAQYPEPQPYKTTPSYNTPTTSYYNTPPTSYSTPAPTYQQPKLL